MKRNLPPPAGSTAAAEKAAGYMVHILKYGLFALPVISLIVSDSLFFPHITGKNYFFRIGTEIFLVLWIWVNILDRRYGPQKSPILVTLTAFLAILSLATIFGENPRLSFWSNYERMEGLISHLHLFAYFLIITSIFREEKDWRRYFYALAAVSFILTIYGMGQIIGQTGENRVSGTFGNASYLAVFMMFHIFLLFLLLRWTSNSYLRILFALFIGLEATVLIATKTRGAMVGFSLGIALLTLLTAIFSKSRKGRHFATVMIVLILALSGAFFLIENTSFVKENAILDRIASVHLDTEQMRLRLGVWKTAVKGFRNHPVLGYGPENFPVPFNRYYDPSLVSTEIRFDRAHNIFVEWLIAAGISGLLAYLSVWGAVFYCLRKSLKQQRLEPMDASIISSLLVGYLLYNLVLFDNIVSYFLFFTVLGFIHFGYSTSGVRSKSKNTVSIGRRPPNKSLYAVLPLSFVGVMFSLYSANIKPLLAEKQLSRISRDFVEKRKNVDMILKDFERILSYRTFGTTDTREELKFFANYVFASNLDRADKLKALNKAIEEMEKQVREAPQDMRHHVYLASLYKNSGRFEDALAALSDALALSPRRPSILLDIAEVYLASEQEEKALAVLKEAYALNPENNQSGINLAVVAVLNDRKDYAETLMDRHFDGKTMPDSGLLSAYRKSGSYTKLKEIWQMFVERAPRSVQYRVNLAAAYSKAGDYDSAVRELLTAIAFAPHFRERGSFYIQELRAGRDPF